MLLPQRRERFASLIEAAQLGQTGAAHALASVKSRAQSQQLCCISERFPKSTGEIVGNRNAAEKHRHLGIKRTEPDCLLAVRDRLVLSPAKASP